MKVLVTGGRGFLGTHVCTALREAGHDPVPLGRADGDLAEEGTIERLLGEHAPDTVIHLAAGLPGDERLDENAPIAELVAVACADRIPLFHGSTTAVYYDETPYAETKRASEEAAGEATILRFHYPYGPHMRRGAIPTMLRQALAGEPVVAYRGWLRSFCFAPDAAEAVAILLSHEVRGDWDVGRDDDLRSLEDVATLACAAAGADDSLVVLADPPEGYAPLIESLDTERLRSLGWRPRTPLEDGIRSTLEWIREAA
ncbi:MAG: NAD-dependent epimerase/dehydratase family protein [Gaiellaceae bacterium]